MHYHAFFTLFPNVTKIAFFGGKCRHQQNASGLRRIYIFLGSLLAKLLLRQVLVFFDMYNG